MLMLSGSWELLSSLFKDDRAVLEELLVQIRTHQTSPPTGVSTAIWKKTVQVPSNCRFMSRALRRRLKEQRGASKAPPSGVLTSDVQASGLCMDHSIASTLNPLRTDSNLTRFGGVSTAESYSLNEKRNSRGDGLLKLTASASVLTSHPPGESLPYSPLHSLEATGDSSLGHASPVLRSESCQEGSSREVAIEAVKSRLRAMARRASTSNSIPLQSSGVFSPREAEPDFVSSTAHEGLEGSLFRLASKSSTRESLRASGGSLTSSVNSNIRLMSGGSGSTSGHMYSMRTKG